MDLQFNSDKIEIYKDDKLLNLRGKWNALEVAELNFLLSKTEVDKNGRTVCDVARDEITVLEETNAHLRSYYDSNGVAKRWLAVNQFTIDRLKEDIISAD